MGYSRRKFALALTAGFAYAAHALSQDVERRNFSLPEEDLSRGLLEFARTTHSEIFVPHTLLAGKRANAVRGEYTPQEALDLLLDCTGFEGRIVDGIIRIRTKDQQPSPNCRAAVS